MPAFEEIDPRAGPDFGAIAWAVLAPHPALVVWLDRQPPSHTALVIGCGLGDDAQQVSERGDRVAACDPVADGDRSLPGTVPPLRGRLPGAADLLALLPCRWGTVFDLVVEIRPLQSLPPSRYAAADAAMASTVRPGGRVFVRCLARMRLFGVLARRAGGGDTPAGIPGRADLAWLCPRWVRSPVRGRCRSVGAGVGGVAGVLMADPGGRAGRGRR